MKKRACYIFEELLQQSSGAMKNLASGALCLWMVACGQQNDGATHSVATSAVSLEGAATTQNDVPETPFGHWWVDVRALLVDGATGSHLQPSGIVILDVDGDGRDDLIVSNGYEQQSQPIIILRNTGGSPGESDDSPPEFAPFDPKALMYSLSLIHI